MLALLGHFYPYNRGELMVALVLLYAFSSGVAGYVSGRWFSMLGGTAAARTSPSDDDWAKTVVITATLLNGPIVGTFMFLNTTALIFRSTQASRGCV